jgi:hypothetical protein
MRKLAKQFGEAAAEDIAAFVVKHMYAMKKTVEEEGLDCEFELRRSYDVWCNEKEAGDAKAYVKASHRAGQAWAAGVDLVADKYAEQVRRPTSP